MSRLIDADKLKAKLEPELGGYYPDVYSYFKPAYIAVKAVMNAIDNAPTVMDWIPVTKELPREYTMVLATIEHYHNPDNITEDIVWLKNGIWTNGVRTFDSYAVLAWMPLPDFYEGDRNGDK